MDRTDRLTEIAQRFERSILSGEREPEDLLPSERELGAQPGASRKSPCGFSTRGPIPEATPSAHGVFVFR